MAKAAEICYKMGYDEININCGCPSPKVKEGAFGAILMFDPEKVAENVREMIKMSHGVPITIKCRLGVDEHDSFEELVKFINIVSKAGVTHFVMHARKAILHGFNPKENRNIPPLKYDWVYKLADMFPTLQFSLNGGLNTIEQMQEVLAPEHKLKGCMIGRLAYNDPWILGRIDHEIYGMSHFDLSKKEVILKYAEFVEKEQKEDKMMCNSLLVKPLSFFFNGERDSNKYRRFLGDAAKDEKYKNNCRQLIEDALEILGQHNPTALNKTHDK